jgi:hypothetical protein
MNEAERRDLADATDRYSYELVKQACEIIASRERPSIVGKLEQYTEKDGVIAKLKFGSTAEVVSALHEPAGRKCSWSLPASISSRAKRPLSISRLTNRSSALARNTRAVSNLNPGGSRSPVGRVFGAQNISRACKARLKDRDAEADAQTSIATDNRHGGEHGNSREIARRLRQEARRSK